MEEDKKLNYDSDIIIYDDIPDTISVTSSPEKLKKPEAKKLKTKKHKRKVKKTVNCNNNVDTLLITQKLKVKKTRFKCVININTLQKRKSDSIVRFATNVCRKEAYYHRIQPICSRETCFDDKNYTFTSCCRPTAGKLFKDYIIPKAGNMSPISSVAEEFCNDISYEDVSNGNFSSASDEELDTLIKRTKQRDKQFEDSHSARQYVTSSTPISKTEDNPSPHSTDMCKSINSDTTVILNTLASGAYSPTASLDSIEIDNTGRPTKNPDYEINNMIHNDVYFPRNTTDLKENDNDYIPMRNAEMENLYDHVLSLHTHNDCNVPYSPTFNPDLIEIVNLDNRKFDNRNINDNVYEPHSPTMTPDLIKKEDLNILNKPISRAAHEDVNGAYSPSSPTMSPDRMKTNFNQVTITQMDNACSYNVGYSPSVTSDNIKMENEDY